MHCGAPLNCSSLLSISSRTQLPYFFGRHSQLSRRTSDAKVAGSARSSKRTPRRTSRGAPISKSSLAGGLEDATEGAQRGDTCPGDLRKGKPPLPGGPVGVDGAEEKAGSRSEDLMGGTGGGFLLGGGREGGNSASPLGVMLHNISNSQIV